MAFMHYTAAAEDLSEEQADEVYSRVGDLLAELEQELGLPFIAWGGSWTADESEIAVEAVKAYRETAAILDKLDRITRLAKGCSLSSNSQDYVKTNAEIMKVLGLWDDEPA